MKTWLTSIAINTCRDMQRSSWMRHIDRRVTPDQLPHAAETRLSGLTPDPWLAQRVLQNVKGEEKVKRKLSAGLVLLVILMLVTMTALAVTVLSHYFNDYAQLEGAYGDYSQWSDSAKIHLVEVMATDGLALDDHLLEQFENIQLNEPERAKLAEDIICAYYGDTDNMSTYNVMEHELGAFGSESWSLADQELYSDLTKEYGIGSTDQTQHKTPKEGEDISEETAKTIAKATLLESYSISDEELSAYTISCTFFTRSGDSKEWLIRYVGEDTPEYQNNVYTVSMTNDGQVIETRSPWLACPLNTEFEQLENERGMFVTWSVKQKFQFYAEWPQKIDKWIEHGGDSKHLRSHIQYLSNIQYCLPAEDEVDALTSRQTAEEALRAQEHVTTEDMDELRAYPSFRMTDQGTRVWHWVFARLQRENTDCGYYVEVDAQTGEVTAIVHMIYDVDTNHWADFYEY